MLILALALDTFDGSPAVAWLIVCAIVLGLVASQGGC